MHVFADYYLSDAFYWFEWMILIFELIGPWEIWMKF